MPTFPYMFRRALTRGTRWFPNYFASFLSSKGISKNVFAKNDYFDLYRPLAPKPLIIGLF